MALYVGLDIGGTKFMAAASDGRGHAGTTIREPTPQPLQDGLRLLKEMVKRVSAGCRLDGIGAAIGGPLDWRTGVVSPLHQDQWRNVPLKSMMETWFGCPFHVDVDTNVAALGEHRQFGRGARRLLYLTLSTGMGGGFIVDGRIYRGAGGEHPEVAHQSILFRCSYPERIVCECGCGDCLEALVSGNGIRRIYGRPAEQLDDGQWQEVAWNLGQGLRNLATIYLPDVIVLGGGIAHARGEKLLRPARRVMRQHLKLVPAPKVRLSHYGYDTALAGALMIAREGLEDT
ncbi:MAG: ROK family protein [Planctomycetes bacterium]|nr:ROK family protein [Planctomycetota bacterium]